MMGRWVVFFVSAFLFGCASVPEKSCRPPQWEMEGKMDGVRGKTLEEIHNFIFSCQDILVPEIALREYSSGWMEGHQEFCANEDAFLAGLRGKNDPKFCNDTLHGKNYSEQYGLGVVEKNKKVAAEVPRPNSSVFSQSPSQDLFSVVNHNSTNTADIDFENVLNYTGVFVGSVQGFGIGHIFQGRYLQDGWKWTLGEISILGLLAHYSESSVVVCSSTSINNKCQETTPQKTLNTEQTQNNNSSIQTAILIGWLGYKVWQGVDLYSYASSVSQKKSTKAQMLVLPNSVLVTYQF